MSYGYSVQLVQANKQSSVQNLGVRLGRACIKANIPVANIATQLGVSKQTVYNWFTGAYNPQKTLAPAVEKLIAVIGTP